MTAEILELPIDSLVHRCRDGDGRAFRPIVRAYEGLVYSYIRRMVGNKETASDLCQETFLRAFRALERFREGAQLRPWLLRIARNLAIDHLRQREPSALGLDADHDLDALTTFAGGGGGDNPERALDRKRALQAVEDAVAGLRPAYREALVLHAIEGVPYEEISQITGDTVMSLKIRVVRARLALRRALSRKEDEGHDS